ncbi:hypothetical protein [Clostridium intestinale]|uniref:Uncharacterized protein n=1 Tax=Clostridium intestinale DSM 6191 TaxID=1121320 RepID=A0A1M5U2S7_9CLOT|nr:hypothetical protein [Clostridium intestinale]SHH57264.1 hypothetical protein SAMN02745941_00390 [Clostridium intestinale DSM 6191]
MEKKRNSRVGIISFVFAVLPILYMIIQTFIDVYFPNQMQFGKLAALTLITINIMFASFLTSFILGIIAVRKKECKRVLPIIALVLSSLFLLIMTISAIGILLQILNM